MHMTSFKVGYLVGSLAKNSINRKLAKALIRLAPHGMEFSEIRFGDLPLYSYDYDDDYPEVARSFKAAIRASDAILFVTPEYNRSIPGGLKNAIDWASRPYGTNAFTRKPSAVLDRHRCRPAEPEERAELLQLAPDDRAGGLHPVHAGDDHR
jgi:chromate reductase